jgi:hypothetical protein
MFFQTRKFILQRLNNGDSRVTMEADKRLVGDFDIDHLIEFLINQHIGDIRRLLNLFDEPEERKFLDDPQAQAILANMIKPKKDTTDIRREYHNAIIDAYCWTYGLNFETFRSIV